MDSKLKCIICGTIATTFFLAHNNPICDSCHEKIKATPHTVEVNYVGPVETGGTSMVINITSSATVITVSTSSSTTTTQPPEVV